MAKTRAQLVARALAKNKVVGAGQSASAEVTQRVDDVVEPLMEDLSERGIFSWGNEDEIPESAFEHLAGLLADATADDFGKEQNEQKRNVLEARLRLLNTTELSGQVLKTEFY